MCTNAPGCPTSTGIRITSPHSLQRLGIAERDARRSQTVRENGKGKRNCWVKDHNTASRLSSKTRSCCRYSLFASTTLSKPYVRANPPALSVQTFGTRVETRRTESHHRSKNGPEWHKLAGPGWLARPSSRRQNAKTPRLSPAWKYRPSGGLARSAISKSLSIWLALGLLIQACPRPKGGKGKMEKSSPCHPLSGAASVWAWACLVPFFSARQHPHRFSTDGCRRHRNWHLTTKFTGRCHSHDFGGIESETGVAGTTRQGPIHLAEPSLVSLEAGQCYDYNGRLVDEMPSPPRNQHALPAPRALIPLDQAYQAGPSPHGGGEAPEHPKRPSAGLPPLVALQSVAPGTASVKRGG